MTDSLSLLAEPESSTLLTTKPATGNEQEPIPFYIKFNAAIHSITSSVVGTFQEVRSFKFCIRLSPLYDLMLVIEQ
jgi:hypothetical protein